VSVQAAILNLLASLQHEERTSYLFITHDIGVVRYLADRIAVMYVGRIMEKGVLNVDGEASKRIPLEGDIPSPADPPPGCVFHTRCQYHMPGTCDVTEPEDIEVGPRHQIRCHLPVEKLPTPVTISKKLKA